MSQSEFLVMTEKNIFAYTRFLSLNIWDFNWFVWKLHHHPLKKVTPFPSNSPLKVEVLSTPPFEYLVGGVQPPTPAPPSPPPKKPFCNDYSPSKLYLTFKRFIMLIQTKKVIYMNYGCSISTCKPWRWVRLDLIFTMRDMYINSNLSPLTKSTSNSRSTEFKVILPWNISQMISIALLWDNIIFSKNINILLESCGLYILKHIYFLLVKVSSNTSAHYAYARIPSIFCI